MKVCKSCGVSLTPENTYKSNRSTCKGCLIKQSKEYLKGKPVEYRMWHGAKTRAKAKGIPFDIDIDDVVIPAACPVFGVPLEIAEGSRGAGDFSPTLDKIIPELGYTKGNVCVISWKANRLKSNGTLEDFEAIVSWLKGRTQNVAKI